MAPLHNKPRPMEHSKEGCAVVYTADLCVVGYECVEKKMKTFVDSETVPSIDVIYEKMIEKGFDRTMSSHAFDAEFLMQYFLVMNKWVKKHFHKETRWESFIRRFKK